MACLARLPPDSRARIALAATVLTTKRGHVLVHAGEKPSGFHILAEGRIDLVSHMPDRPAKVLDILRPGQSFGEAFLFLGRRYTYDALTAIDSTVLFFAGAMVLTEVAACPRFAGEMLAVLSRQLIDAIELAQSHALSGTQRFAQLLLRYGTVETKSGRLRLKLPARKAEVASLIDLSPEHLSRLLRTMSNRGLISISGSFIDIIDPSALRAIVRGTARGGG